MHFGSGKKRVLGVQHRSGAGGLVKRGSRALWGAQGAESGGLTWKTDTPIVWEKLLGVCLFSLVFFQGLSFFTWDEKLCLPEQRVPQELPGAVVIPSLAEPFFESSSPYLCLVTL